MNDPSPFETYLRELIATAGPMPVWRYMQICMTHPDYGYYISRDPLGRGGDFTTAPEISQMFGELIGLWAASVWNEMGMPQHVQLIELGPGRGTMMADALRALRIVPAFLNTVEVHLIEVSPSLRAIQRDTLADGKSIHWHASLDDIPPGPSIILGNEYFDVLPIHQMVKLDNGWHERVVDIDDEGFIFSAAPEPTPRFEISLRSHIRAAPDGAIFEWRENYEIMSIARRVRDYGGAALFIDYGHTRSDAGDTLQAVSQHRFADPLKAPGVCDITAHVDFQALAEAAQAMGARTHGPIEQGEFLHRLGIETRAQTLMKHSSTEGAHDIANALKRLVARGQNNMGSLFKVLAVSHPSLHALAALSDHPNETVA